MKVKFNINLLLENYYFIKNHARYIEKILYTLY
jgi:hypothetical protein